MATMRSILEALVGLRKLLFSIGALVFIGIGLFAILVVFIVNWYLGTNVITGENLANIFIAGFQNAAVVVSAYLAVNVANKWVNEWLSKKRK